MITNYNFLFSVHEITNTAKVTDMIIIVARKTTKFISCITHHIII